MREIKAHTGLRGIAAVVVFLGHAQFDQLWGGAFWLGGLYSFFYWQNPAVDLFFMLSGFILNYVYLKERRLKWGSYFHARFARICPLYYMGLFAVLAMNLAAAHLDHQPGPDLKTSIILPNLAMVQEWPVFGFIPSINIPSWSISVEVFLYIFVFPLFALLLARGKFPKALSLAVLVIALLIDMLVSRDWLHPLSLQYSGLLRGITGFTVGFMICELLHKREAPLVSAVAEMVLAALVVALLPFDRLHPFLLIGFAALIAVTYAPASRLGVILGSPFFFYLGGISYSVYIWQSPVLKACTLVFAMRHMGATSMEPQITAIHKLLYCIGTILTLAAVANISYYWIETPLRRMLRRPARDRLKAEPLPGSLKT